MSSNYKRMEGEEIFYGQPQLDDYKTKPRYQANTIFRINREDLGLFFDQKNLKKPINYGESRMSLNILKECGYNGGMAQLLVTDKDTGIIGDEADLRRRQLLFGRNQVRLPSITSFKDLLASQYEDSSVCFLIISATVYVCLALFAEQNMHVFIEALTIYSGVFFSTLISALCDWIKERQFLKLRDEINNMKVVVYRGQYGNVSEQLSKDLVVGDIIDVQQGDRVPADCILLEEMNIEVDESLYKASHTKVKKELSIYYGPVTDDNPDQDNHIENPDPFLLTGSLVMRGAGRAMVCAVGKHTRLAKSQEEEDLVIKEQDTHLEQKLKFISE